MEKEYGVAYTLQNLGKAPQVRLPMDKRFLAQPIDNLTLSVRARNALMRAGLDTVYKLVAYIREHGGLDNIRNLGKKSILEVKLELVSAAYSRLTDQEKQDFWRYTVPQPDFSPIETYVRIINRDYLE